MKKAAGDHGQYVRKVQATTQRYSQNLLEENERLRVKLAGCEAAQHELETRLASLDQLHQNVQAQVVRALAERTRVVAALEATRFELQQREALHEDLRRKLEAAEQDSQRFSRGYFDVERQNANLANLYVASYQLHGTLDQGEVLLAIQEILANLVGCEEIALFELAPDTTRLRLVRSCGIDPGAFEAVSLGQGVIGGAALSGEIVIAPELGATPFAGEEHLTACVPVRLAGAVVGVIALFRLLAHKPALEELDRELFELLAQQAGMALYCTKLHAARVRV